jgi:hypothetical protein
MMGRLQMSVDECIEEYLKFSKKVFADGRRRFSMFGWPRNKYHTRKLQMAIEEVVSRKSKERKRKDQPLDDNFITDQRTSRTWVQCIQSLLLIIF